MLRPGWPAELLLRGRDHLLIVQPGRSRFGIQFIPSQPGDELPRAERYRPCSSSTNAYVIGGGPPPAGTQPRDGQTSWGGRRMVIG